MNKEVLTKEEYWKCYYSYTLCKNHKDDFDIWWDSDRFDWDWDSGSLCEYLPDKFDIWWDPNKFDWIGNSWKLCSYIPDKFDTWWDKYKFNWDHCNYLCEYLPNRFDDWWDGRRFKFKYCSNYLILNIPHKLYKWGVCKKLNIDTVNECINNLEWYYE